MTHTFTRAKASLNALNRALSAVPDRRSLPNIEFIMSSEDYDSGGQPMWVYAKKSGDDWAWLMPDFGYWSWPEAKVGSYSNVRDRIIAVDEGTTIRGKTIPGLKFQDKKKQLLWRGNTETGPELRNKLVEVSSGKSWSSVEPINWGDKGQLKKNFVSVEDHCRYMFLAHVEGRSYSGRGKYVQNCRSVAVAHELVWKEAHHGALVATGHDANFVQVKRDFSDLENKIHYLIEHPKVAERIANNSVETFRDRYLTSAAEGCYWRELIRAYGSVCDFEPNLYTDSKGKNPRAVPFESFVLDGELITEASKDGF